MSKKRNKAICPQCGHRLAFCTAEIDEFTPDQEPYESGVEEEVEGTNINYNIGLSIDDFVLVYAFVCPQCCKAVHVWCDDAEAPKLAVLRLEKELGEARAELAEAQQLQRRIRSCVKEAAAACNRIEPMLKKARPHE